MGVRKGYKQSEVGVIPEDWESPSVGKIASFSSGVGISIAGLSAENSYAHVPVYGGNGIAGYTKVPLVSATTVVIGRVGQKCGEVYLTDGASWVSDNALYPRKFHQKINLRFFALALGCAGLNELKNRNDLPLVTQAILHNAVIPLPSTVDEQERIAEVLSDADALIESLEQLLAKKRHIKQGAMQELLTGEKRLPGFGGQWQTRSLGDIGSFLKGRGISKDQALSGDLACVRYGELYTRHDDYIRTFHSWISRDVAASSTCLHYGDILFAGSGETKEEIGKCAAFVDRFEAFAGGDIVILRTDQADPLFLGYYLNTASIVRQKASLGQGDAVVHIGASALASIQGIFPPISEQTAIAAVLTDMDTEIAMLEVKLTKARQLKTGMMQELLTGRIRLI